MFFSETAIQGAYIISLEKHEDERGFFARTWCKKEFKNKGLNSDLVQCNISYNKEKGTLRGMHYQTFPYEEVKLVSCIVGAVYDVIVDIRKDSSTYGKWFGIELTARNNKAIYIPKGLAHGFQTLLDNSVVFYQMSEFYHPENARGFSWHDKKFNIEWPVEKKIISEKDNLYNDFK